MNALENAVLNLIATTYDIQYSLQNDWLILSDMKQDIFKINLKDSDRFKIYTVYHQNHQNHLNGKKYYHIQIKTKSLPYAIFVAGTHSFNVTYGIRNRQEDYLRFLSDSKLTLKGEL